MYRITLAVLVITVASCGGQSIEQRVADQYPDYARTHGIDKTATRNPTVTCNHDATRDYDGVCTIRPEGFTLTYKVPYRDDKPLWGESGVQ